MNYIEPLLEVKGFEEEQGIFEGYASIFGNVDLGDDIVESGAFTESIAKRMPLGQIKILSQHDSGMLPVGKPVELREDSRGLYIKGQISDTQIGRDLKTLLRDGVLTELSIGYQALDYEFDDRGKRHIKKADLYEISPVTWAMNPQARIYAYKQRGDTMEDVNKPDAATTLPIEEKQEPQIAEQPTTETANAEQATESKLDDVVFSFEVKAGRKLSKARREKLAAALESLKAVFDETEDDAEEDPEEKADDPEQDDDDETIEIEDDEEDDEEDDTH